MQRPPGLLAGPLAGLVAGVGWLLAASAALGGDPLVTWTFVGNNEPGEGLCSAELDFRVDDASGIPGGVTELYFNFGRKPAEVGGGYEHVNGDLFRLRLDTDGKLPSARRLRLVARGAIQSVTDAPAGFFLVVRRPNGEETVRPLDVAIELSRLREDEESKATPPTPVPEGPPGDGPSAPVVPQPLRYEVMPGTVRLDELPIVESRVIGDHSLAVELIASTILAAGGQPPERLDASGPVRFPSIRVGLLPTTVGGEFRSPGEEAYVLEIRPESGVLLGSPDRAGLYYGAQTLAALIANCPQPEGGPISLPAMRIEDAPHFRYRGLHLDVARNFQSAATVRKLLDLMATYKLNRLHLHLTDDEGWRVAIRGLPELTEVGGRRGYSPGFRDILPPSFGSGPEPGRSPGSGHYSRDEFIALLQYAAERHIEVIPEIDLPGHSRAAIQAMRVRYERLRAAGDPVAAEEFLLRRPDDTDSYESVQMWSDNVVDVRLESTHRFFEHFIEDLKSQYAEAGLELRMLHLGGDEVPHGCWGELSDEASAELFVNFMNRCAFTLGCRGIRPAGWEEVFLAETEDASPQRGAASAGLCYAWNNIWGWGQEDAAYRLANAGVEVVLCNATHLYFDLAAKRHVDEPGYYWAGTTDTREVFSFRPYDYLSGLTQDRLGRPIQETERDAKAQLAPTRRDRIAGIQGHLWGENLNSPERLEHLAFPRLLALAERAWVGPGREASEGKDPTRSWRQFATHVGRRELPRLDRTGGGVRYRIPSVRIERREAGVFAASELPGLVIRYTTDGTEPTSASRRFNDVLPDGSHYRFRAFNRLGRGGPTAVWRPQPEPRDEPNESQSTDGGSIPNARS